MSELWLCMMPVLQVVCEDAFGVVIVLIGMYVVVDCDESVCVKAGKHLVGFDCGSGRCDDTLAVVCCVLLGWLLK